MPKPLFRIYSKIVQDIMAMQRLHQDHGADSVAVKVLYIAHCSKLRDDKTLNWMNTASGAVSNVTGNTRVGGT